MTRFNYLLVFVFSACLNSAKADNTTKAGDIIQIAIPAIAFTSTFYLDDQDGRMPFYKSFATNLLITHGMKRITNKRRPDGSDRRSFPSGHTSAAFQGAAFIHFRYGLKYAIPAYLGAGFVGYSRVKADKHDYLDVLAGATVGVLSTWYFTQPWEGGIFHSMKSNNLVPVIEGDSFKLMFYKRW